MQITELCVSTAPSVLAGRLFLLCAMGFKKIAITFSKILDDLRKPWLLCVAVSDWTHHGPAMKQFHTTAYALQCQSCHPLPTQAGKVQHSVRGKLDFCHSLLCSSWLQSSAVSHNMLGWKKKFSKIWMMKCLRNVDAASKRHGWSSFNGDLWPGLSQAGQPYHHYQIICSTFTVL